MNVELECYAKLAKSGRCNFMEPTPYKLKAGQTVADLVRQANLPHQDIEFVSVNNSIANTDTVLLDGDRVGLVPVFGGG